MHRTLKKASTELRFALSGLRCFILLTKKINQMTQTNNTLQDIAALLLEHSIDQREQLLFEELDRVTIYRSNCWAILAEIQPTDFACNMSGGWHKTPEHLVWSLLHERFLNEYGILLDN